MFESLRARLERMLGEHTRDDPRREAAALREALLEAKVGITGLRDALAATERELAAERKHLADAERRGRLAAEVPDPETVAVAERYAARHRERAVVLERKLEVQREELALAEREVAELHARFRSTRAGASDSVQAAWRDLEAAGATRPTDDSDAALAAEADRKLRERAIDEQLAYLKRKLGRSGEK